MKFEKVWVIAGSASAVPSLLAAGKALGENVSLVNAAAQAEADGNSVANYARGIASAVKEAAPQLVIVDNSKNGRLLAGFVAAAVKANVLSDPAELCTEDGVCGKRMVYGGAAFKTEKALSATAVVCTAPLYEEDGSQADQLVRRARSEKP